MNRRPRLLQALKWLRKRLPLILSLSLLVLLFIGLIAFLYAVPWSGLGERPNLSEDVEPAKTLWDWLELLIVPAILALGALWFNNQTRNREREQEERRIQEQRVLEQDRYKEEALQTYFDKMTELILKEKLNSDSVSEQVKGVASLRTITVLRRLNQDRRNEVIGFLRDSGLLTGERSILAGEVMEGIDLSGAHLSEANLYKTNLTGANLLGANLSKAILFGANLSDTNLNGANLFRANLNGAKLFKVNLHGTDLREANLDVANLLGANLSKAILFGANLSRAILFGANLSEANLFKANLHRTDLRMANLNGVNLTGAEVTPEQLTQAALDETTIMPDGLPLNESSFMKQGGSEAP